jgi:hypothetical protein
VDRAGLLHRRIGASPRRRPIDDDAIWRGEIPDDQIIMTDEDRAELQRSRDARRRSLIDVFGAPVPLVAADGPALVHARRGEGTRSGAPLDQRRSAGCREEIQVTLLAHPAVTADVIEESGVLDTSSRLVVDAATVRRIDREITWNAEVRTTPWTRRRARLRLYGSPSANITVLTLTPLRSRRWGVRLFLRSGLRSMFEVRDAAEREIDRSSADQSGSTWPMGVALRT